MIPREVIEEIVRRSDIEQVIGQYVELRRAGSNLVGLCPFHSEKSPSFTVFPKSNSFYCFGCGAGGDAITFVKKHENLDYVAAVEVLAARAGVTIPEDRTGIKDTGPSRDRIRKMNTDAAKFFHACLMKDPEAEEAREYFNKRKLTQGTIKHFYLGYAPGKGRLVRHLKSLGYTEEEMLAGFLARKNQDGKIYDLFWNRVMFPIVDTSRNIVAFGGRVLDDSKPKYLNTSDTPAFKKSRNLFALNYAKDFCQDRLIVCEGYMDVVTLHQAGFQYAVATLGTAITEEHARILSKYTKCVILSYDSDEAGIKATNRAMSVLKPVGVDVKVLSIKDAKDPDEYIKKFGADAFGRVIDGSSSGFEYKLSTVLAKYNLQDTNDKIKAVEDITGIIAGYYSKVEREVYVSDAAAKLGVSPQSLSADVENTRKRFDRKNMADENSAAHALAARYNDRTNPEAASNPKAASAEEAVLGLLLIYPEYREAVRSGKISLGADDFVTTFNRGVFETLINEYDEENPSLSESLLNEKYDSDGMGRIMFMRMQRQELRDNGFEVFNAAAETLKSASGAKTAAGPASVADALAAKRRMLDEKRKKET